MVKRKFVSTRTLQPGMKIDQAILELAVDGKLTELSEKYFGADISQE